MKEQRYKARRDEHLGMERAMAADHGNVRKHVAEELKQHAMHIHHAKKMHQHGAHKKG